MSRFAFLFPGQGAQYVGMGKDFYDHFAEARELFEEAEDLLGQSIARFMFEGPQSELLITKNCQMALFVSSLAMVAVLQKQFPHLVPAACAGLSLGEYTALVASKHASFKSLCPLVWLRGELMERACRTTEGSMAAILGLKAQEVDELVKELNMPSELWVANYNTPLQTVISGTKKALERVSELARAKGAKRIIALSVDGAFHSGLMKSAEDQLKVKLEQLPLQKGECGMVMNAKGDFVEGVENVREALYCQITHSVRWCQGIEAMARLGVDCFVEIGAGKVLSGFNRQIVPTLETINIGQISDLEKLEGK